MEYLEFKVWVLGFLSFVIVYDSYGCSKVLDFDFLINGLFIRYFLVVGNMRGEEDKGYLFWENFF